MLNDAKVILIGGTSGAGKTTLGRNLAIKLGFTSLTIDDLMMAIRAVTTPETHPGLHVMKTTPYQEYYTNSSVDKLIADTNIQHDASWHAVEKVIRNHAMSWGSPIVIDGWVLRPQRVVDLQLEIVKSFWLVIDESVLEKRERKNKDFLEGSSDTEKMFNNFMGRSRWYNKFTKEQATKMNLPILYQDGNKSVDELCDIVLKSIN